MIHTSQLNIGDAGEGGKELGPGGGTILEGRLLEDLFWSRSNLVNLAILFIPQMIQDNKLNHLMIPRPCSGDRQVRPQGSPAQRPTRTQRAAG